MKILDFFLKFMGKMDRLARAGAAQKSTGFATLLKKHIYFTFELHIPGAKPGILLPPVAS
jgi:hypothetical protein